MPRQNHNIPAPQPFNPLDKKNLGESVAEAMIEGPIHRLPPERFVGAGIYAIYYVGDFEPYRELSDRNREGRFERPIYVGKAVPPGARKGGFGLGEEPGEVLSNRLKQHYQSVRAAENLNENDFFCRYLVVEDIWIPLAESLLIEKFQPVWNRILDGFGNHAPGGGREEQKRSSWDEVHRGRAWAEHLNPCASSKDDLLNAVRDFLRNHDEE